MGAPVVLMVVDEPCPGCISAYRVGEPSFTHVQDMGDAMQAALSRGVDLVIPEEVMASEGADLPADLPAWIRVGSAAD